MQNYRISSLDICRRKITCICPQEDENSIENARPIRARGVIERNPSLHSGRIDSIQNSEAELQNFEAQQQKLKLLH